MEKVALCMQVVELEAALTNNKAIGLNFSFVLLSVSVMSCLVASPGGP